MAVAYRSDTVSAFATAANITATEPSGAAQNDILIAFLYIESDTAVTAPSGWSNSFNGTTMLAECNTASHDFRMYAYWIRRGASAPSYAWTHSSAFRGIVIVAYSGCVTTEQPFSFGVPVVRDDTTAATWPSTSGTTLTANELLVWAGLGFGMAGAGTPPTGYTEDVDASGGVELASKSQAVAGGTGTVSGASYGASNDTVALCFCGLKSVAVAAGRTTHNTSSHPSGIGLGIGFGMGRGYPTKVG